MGITTSPVLHMTLRRNLPVWSVITPRRACATRGKVIDVGLYIYICKKFQNFFESFKVLSNTGRLLFEFNRLQYTLAAPEVFVAFANPVSLPSGYRVGIVRNTNIDQIKTTPLRYSQLDTVEHAYSRSTAAASSKAFRQAGCVCYYLQTVGHKTTYGSGPAWEGGSTWCLGNTPGSTFLSCSISLHLKRSMGDC